MLNKILLRDNRQLIPRWHTSRKAYKLQFTQNIINQSSDVDTFRIDWSIDNWHKQKNIQNALDLFLRLQQVNKTDIDEYEITKNFLLQNKANLTNTILQQIEPNLIFADKNKTYSTYYKDIHNIIRKLKKSVREYSEDPLNWLDLGFYYTVIGETLKAFKCMHIGYNLNPTHPFIAKSYSRFMIHQENPEKAFHILQKTGLIKTNPIITSAALSISNAFGIGNINVKSAKNLLESFNGNQMMTSELAASIGTLEFQNGAIKKGKKLFSSALVNPTENTLAQSRWLHHKHGIILPYDGDPLRKSLEGEATELYVNNNFTKCASKLVELHSFQPFSDSAIVDAGYISIVGSDDYEFVINMSDKRVSRQQMGFEELNNLIVAKIKTKQLDDIDFEFDDLANKIDKENKPQMGTYIATAGMLEFALGNFDQGKENYEVSIDYFVKNKLEDALAVALKFYSDELKNINDGSYIELNLASQKLAKKHKLIELIDNKQTDSKIND